MSPRRLLLGLLTVLLVAVTLSASPGANSASAAPWNGTSLGVRLGGGGKVADLAKYEKWLGTDVDLVVQFMNKNSWAEAKSTLQWILRIRKNDNREMSLSVPMLMDSGGTLKQGAAGQYDKYFREYAQMLVAGGQKDAILRIGWESDGGWFRWSARKDPQNFKKYFQRIVTVMRSVPGQRFEIDWNTDVNAFKNPTSYYPGDAYVDIVSVDVYDRSYSVKAKTPQQRWEHMKTRAGGLNWVTSFAKARGKKIAIPEWGLSQRHVKGENPDNPYFITQMAKFIANNNVRYASYFERNNADRHALMGGTYPKAAKEFRRVFGTGSGSGGSAPTTAPAPTPTTKPGSGGTTVTTPPAPSGYPTNIKDPVLKAERDAAASAACKTASASTVGSKAKKKSACSKAALAAWKAKKVEQLAIINGGGSTPTTSPSPTKPAPSGYPTNIKDPVLKAERDAAASAACKLASASTAGSKAEKKASCAEAALAAWKAKKAEQLAIINGL